MAMGKFSFAKALLPVVFFLLLPCFESVVAADNPLLKRLEKVEGLSIPAAQIVNLPNKAVRDGSELVMTLNVNYTHAPNAKDDGSPVHITVAIAPSKGGKTFTDGEGELYLVDKDGKIALKKKAPLVKLCPT